MNNINLKEDETLQLPELKDPGQAQIWREAKQITLENLKMLSIYAASFQAVKCVQTIMNDFHVEAKFLHDNEAVSSLFSWSSEDLIERRKFTLAWLDIFISNMKTVYLNKFKMHKDCAELQRFISALVQSYIKEGSVASKFHLLTSAMNMDSVYGRIDKEKKWNANRIDICIKTLIYPNFYRQRRTYEIRDSFYEQETSQQICVDRYQRYMMNQAAANEEFRKMAGKKAENDIQKKIDDYKQRIADETLRTRSALDAYYEEYYRELPRFEEIEIIFERKRQEVDIEIFRRKLAIEEIRERRRFLAEQMLLYQIEIREMRERTAAKELENRALGLELTMPAVAKKMKHARGKKRRNR